MSAEIRAASGFFALARMIAQSRAYFEAGKSEEGVKFLREADDWVDGLMKGAIEDQGPTSKEFLELGDKLGKIVTDRMEGLNARLLFLEGAYEQMEKRLSDNDI
jgi:hypothetical protein